MDGCPDIEVGTSAGRRGARAAGQRDRRQADGGTALVPEVVVHFVACRDRLAALTPRENEVLALMAEGRSNASIAEALVLTVGAVEKHVASILQKLHLPPSDETHRRVLAVLAYLDAN